MSNIRDLEGYDKNSVSSAVNTQRALSINNQESEKRTQTFVPFASKTFELKHPGNFEVIKKEDCIERFNSYREQLALKAFDKAFKELKKIRMYILNYCLISEVKKN